MLILDDNDVREVLRMEELIPAMEAALADYSAGKVVQPLRMVVPQAQHGGFMVLMGASGEALGVKVLTFFPGNEGVPTHHAVVHLFDPKTGVPLVMMDGNLITEERTAAVSAVATKHLAREDASVLALLGSGVQARSHLKALRLVRDIREVRVWSPRNAGKFAEEFGVAATASAEEAVRGADIVVTVTGAIRPVLRGEWLSPGAHINAVGAPRPEWRELDDGVLSRARIFVDSREACMAESGDVIAAGHVEGEIGEVVAGVTPGRQSPDDITLFKSVGLAVEDVVSASLVYEKMSG